MLQTHRLLLRRLDADDACFILQLVNDPAWLEYIGDKGVRTLQDAQAYIRNGPMAMYAAHGFGLYLAETRDGIPAGICGLLKRDTLDDVDIGFAFLPAFRGQGLAFEAAAATLAYAHDELGLARVVAIASPGNHASIALLEKLGFVFERQLRIGEDTHEVKLYLHRPGPAQASCA